MKPPSLFRPSHRTRGFSLIELMIAMAIGMVIASALVIVFMNVMKTNREQFKSAQQIENGRFSIDLLTNDLRMAGYYGEFAMLPSMPTALPDPCALPADGMITEATTESPFGLHLQGYAAASLTDRPSVPTDCATYLDDATLRPGSDIIVIRRLDTKTLAIGAMPANGDIYAQTDGKLTKMDVQYGGGAAIASDKKADGTTTVELCRKDYTQPISASAIGLPCVSDALARPKTGASIRKVHVSLYFVANCRNGSGSNGKCTTADDTIPTLKRLEWAAGASTTETMEVVPLAEGVEFLKIRYGIDNASGIAGKTQDGSVDTLLPASSITLNVGDDQANWQNVIMVDIRLLARNSESTSDYSDPKAYDLGVATFTPTGSELKYKRHAFTSQVYIMNVGGRRES